MTIFNFPIVDSGGFLHHSHTAEEVNLEMGEQCLVHTTCSNFLRDLWVIRWLPQYLSLSVSGLKSNMEPKYLYASRNSRSAEQTSDHPTVHWVHNNKVQMPSCQHIYYSQVNRVLCPNSRCTFYFHFAKFRPSARAGQDLFCAVITSDLFLPYPHCSGIISTC